MYRLPARALARRPVSRTYHVGQIALASYTSIRHAPVSATSVFESNDGHASSIATLMAVTGMALGLTCTSNAETTNCESSKSMDKGPTPASVAKEDFQSVQAANDIDSMPIYSMDEVAVNDGTDGKPIWMTYGGAICVPDSYDGSLVQISFLYWKSFFLYVNNRRCIRCDRLHCKPSWRLGENHHGSRVCN